MGSPTAIDLFAGGGGAALGLRLAGFRCVAHVEWDPLACETLRAAVASGAIEGDVLEGDVRAVDWTPYVGVDLAWASPPCQIWSSAGDRLGARDTERNGWPWTWAAVDKIGPKWLICENVEGLLHHLAAGHPDGATTPNPDACSRCYFDAVILPEARRRFAHVDWRVLDCADLGVPQHRRRLILACGPQPFRWPDLTHRDPALWLAPGRPWVTVREALGIGVEGVEEDIGAGFAARRGARPASTGDDPSPTIRAGSKGSGPRLILRERHPDALPDAPAGTVRSGGNGHSAPPMWLRTECTDAGSVSVDEPAPTVGGKANTYLHAEDPGVRRAGDTLAGSEPWRLDQPSAAVTATEVKGATPRDMTTPGRSPERASGALWLATGRRRLTTAECAALQGFPPDWPWRGTKTAIYRQIGNAVPPLLAQRLAAVVSANCASGARRAA